MTAPGPGVPAGPTGLPADEPVAEVHAFWRRLGLPGLVDVHTHFMPPRVTAKIREQFDTGGPLIGGSWPLRYRDTDEALVAGLRALGVRRFTALPYAHRPGMAEFLNAWAADFAAAVPEAAHCGTIYPEDGVEDYLARRLEQGLAVVKVHVQVGGFLVTDPALDAAWGLLAEAGTPVVAHVGSGPVGTACTGPGPVAELLARHPRLRLVIAHLGTPEHTDFLDLAERHERVLLDTTMAFVDFSERLGGGYPAALLPRLADLGEKVLLGTDFPNIPYAYHHQLESLERLGLGDDWLRRVCWENGAALLGVPGPGEPAPE